MSRVSADESKVDHIKPMRIAFIHPDLGIGGAERLIVDTALQLQSQGHEVVVFTSHHDKNHCFPQTADGTLQVYELVSMFPRSFFNTLVLPLSILRQMSLVFQLLLSLFLFNYPSTFPRFLHPLLSSCPPLQSFDLFFVDQLSAGVPVLKLLGWTRTIFYCHYPDKEVGNSIAKERAIARGEGGPSILRYFYRIPLDILEEVTTSYSDKILANSKFTAAQFQVSFPRMRRLPRVVYPGINPEDYEVSKVKSALEQLMKDQDESDKKSGHDYEGVKSVKEAVRGVVEATDRPLLISINRFEAKKNIALAIEAFAISRKSAMEKDPKSDAARARLVVAGGYDPRVRDNISTLSECEALCKKHLLPHFTLFFRPQKFAPPASAPGSEYYSGAAVVFLPSLPGPLLYTLLLNPSARALLYTPTEEHFGIVPLEAMVCRLPVVATNTGGPVETVVDAGSLEDASQTDENGTGLLRPANKVLWSKAIESLLNSDPATRRKLGENARKRLIEKFSVQKMGEEVHKACCDAKALGPVRGDEGLYQLGGTLFVFTLMMTFYLIRVHNELGFSAAFSLTPANPSSAVVASGLSSLSSAASASLKAASTTALSGAAAMTASAAAAAWEKKQSFEERFKEFEEWESMKEKKLKEEIGKKVEL